MESRKSVNKIHVREGAEGAWKREEGGEEEAVVKKKILVKILTVKCHKKLVSILNC